MARMKKTPEERADEQRRYALAAAATTDDELEPFLTDPNQAIRSGAIMNRRASAEILSRFAHDAFWGNRVEVARHPNSSRETVLGLLEADPRQRGVVHKAARERLESEGVEFGEDHMPLD
ncbi:hypothetical protein [Brachybacterium tyrofermentans]|uniref:Uncharacterized protein n=1 Tax=Brachybacterium tyrofermentans TaxID=47848 RepID=A0ABW0FKN5_9MICO